MKKLDFLKKLIGASLLENIDFSATNGTFVTNYEFESNFLTTPTKEPKLNHLVNTQWN